MDNTISKMSFLNGQQFITDGGIETTLFITIGLI